MSPAVEERLQAHARLAGPDVERPDPLRAVHLVRGERGEVDTHRFDVEGDLAEPLHGVGMEDDAPLAADRADLGQRVNRADLVVREHEADEDRLAPDRGGDLSGFDPPRPVGREVRDLEAFTLELVAGVEHRVVLGRSRDDVVSLRAVSARRAQDREVVALRGAAREDDLLRRGAHAFRDMASRLVHRRLRLPAEDVAARGRVSERAREVWSHRFEHPRIHGRRGVVVHVDRQLHHGPETGILCRGADADPLQLANRRSDDICPVPPPNSMKQEKYTAAKPKCPTSSSRIRP